MAMMKSVSGITYYVQDLDKTLKFYADLGFREGKHESGSANVYLNWFSIEFRSQDKSSKVDNKNTGQYTNIKVERLDVFYHDLVARGFNPVDMPHKVHAGIRQFSLRDPDGYKLVFFEK